MEISSISIIWQMLNKGLKEVNESFSPISSLEMLVIRIIYLNEMPNPEELISSLNRELSPANSSPTQVKDVKEETLNPKVKEIIDFFPGTKIENLD